jgi:hypothetical protein
MMGSFLHLILIYQGSDIAQNKEKEELIIRIFIKISLLKDVHAS